MNDPFRVVTGTAEHALVVRYGGQSASPRAIDEAMNTVTAHDREVGLVVPAGGQEANGKSLDEPSHSILGNDRLGLVVQARRTKQNGTSTGTLDEPTSTLTATAELGMLVQNMEHNIGRALAEPAPPVTGGGNHMLVQVNRSTKGKAVDRQAAPLDVPARTIAGHGELAIVSLRNNGGTTPSAEPVQSVVGSGYHHGVLVYNGNPGFVQPLEMAAGTVTDRDKQALLVPYFRTGTARPAEEPMGTVTSRDREALVITEADVDDCTFRMLQWHELLRAQAPHDHADGRPYLLTAIARDARGKMRELSNENRVKMIGNMVSSPVATMLGRAVVDMLLGVAA